MFGNKVEGIDTDLLTEQVRLELASERQSSALPQRIAPVATGANETGGDGRAPGPGPLRKFQCWTKTIADKVARSFSRSRILHQEISSIWRWSESITEQLQKAQADVAALEAERDQLKRAIHAMQADLQFQRRRLLRLSEDASVSTRVQVEGVADDQAIKSVLLTFEERFRGPREEIKQRLRVHLAHVGRRLPAQWSKPFLDVGCGRGEWLELLQEAGIEAVGVDSNMFTVNECTRRGLPARQADAFAYLAGLPDRSLSGLSAFHVIEHLSPGQFVLLLQEARRTLVEGGLLILETPNPENLKVGACTFYSDPTHTRPIPPPLCRFVVESEGFAGVEIDRLNPYPPSSLLPELTEADRRLNELMYGPQDYAVIAQKPI